MCSLEVPDIAQGVASHYDNRDDVVVLLANAGNNAGTIQTFLSNAHTNLLSLMDQNESVFRSYDPPEHFAPFPLQIIVDQTGVIRYVSGEYDALAVRQIIDSLVE